MSIANATTTTTASAFMEEAAEPIIISLEGNIGTGKSTLLDELEKRFAKDESICFLKEPVNMWDTIKDASGKTILEKYYADQKRYAFSFQMLAFISRTALMRSALKEKKYRRIIIERSVYTDSAVFAKMLYDDKKIEDIEYAIYSKWVNEFISDFPPIKYIYIQAKPEVSLERVGIRSRPGETIPLEYLQTCHNYHEDWLLVENTRPVLLLDANVDLNKNSAVLADWIKQIEEFIRWILYVYIVDNGGGCWCWATGCS